MFNDVVGLPWSPGQGLVVVLISVNRNEGGFKVGQVFDFDGVYSQTCLGSCPAAHPH
jgi:hypothetical protein